MNDEENKDTEQKVSLIPEKIEGEKDENEDEDLEIDRPVQIEKRQGRWKNLIWWRNNQPIVEGKESEALMLSVLDDDEGEGGDILISDLVYESKADNEGNINYGDINDDTSDKEDNSEENDEAKKEGDLLFFTDVPTKDHGESLKSSSSPTLIIPSSNDEAHLDDDSSESNSVDSSENGSEGSVGDSSESSSEGSSDDSSESSSEDSAAVRKFQQVDRLLRPLENTVCNSNDNSENGSVEIESDDFILKNLSDTVRPALNRRGASTKSFFNNRERQSPVYRSLSVSTSFRDDDEQEDCDYINPDGRKRLYGRIEGIGSSLSSEEKPGRRSFRERLRSFRNRNSGMQKMNIQTSSWTNFVEDTMTEKIAAVVLPSEPFDEGYMIAPGKDIDTKPTSKNPNQRSELVSSKLICEDDRNYIKYLEGELKHKDLAIMCWKNRVRELEEEVNRLEGVIDENLLNSSNTSSDDSTEIEWQTGKSSENDAEIEWQTGKDSENGTKIESQTRKEDLLDL